MRGVRIVEHELYLLIWFQMLKIAPVCIQVVFQALICYNQDDIDSILFQRFWWNIAWIKNVILACVDNLSCLIWVETYRHSNFILSVHADEQIFSLQLLDFKIMYRLLVLLNIDFSREDLPNSHDNLLWGCWSVWLRYRSYNYASYKYKGLHV